MEKLTDVYTYKVADQTDYETYGISVGSDMTLKNGLLHSMDDKPYNSSWDQVWFNEGKVHRENGPARVYNGTSFFWYKNGQVHRDNGLPAMEYDNGRRLWYEHGLPHRIGGLPAVEWCRRDDILFKEWWENGTLFRENDLPVIESSDGLKFWFRGGRVVDEQGCSIKEPHYDDIDWYVDSLAYRLAGNACTIF
jgi:hypothetical protein